MSATTHWNAYLPVGRVLTSDEPGLDPAWCAQMGVDPEALSVLRRVRRDVLPLVRDLQKPKKGFIHAPLRAVSFLIHDRASGVPCPPEDTFTYVHLRVELYHREVKGKDRRPVDAREFFESKWSYVIQVEPTSDELRVQGVLYEQTAWYLRLIEEASGMSDLDLLRHVGQTLHFYSNMAQMVVR